MEISMILENGKKINIKYRGKLEEFITFQKSKFRWY